jgi:rhodanese-related sulfurtransferase
VTFFIDNWFLIVAALISGGLLVWPMIAGGGMAGGGLKPAEAVQLMNREKAMVIDVCSKSEFAAGHVAGARHLPLDQLEAQLSGMVKNKNQALIMVCASGIRSARAVALAKKLGYEKAQSLEGGLKAWRAENLPVEKS